MSFDMELYDVDDDKENEYDGTRLRVRFKGNLIGFASTRAAAYDIMEEHANSPCMSMEVSADMADMEQQIIDLEQNVTHMQSERDYWKELSLSRDGQQLFTQEDVDAKVDSERLRSWKENKQFQYDLAEENAVLRAQLAEKHDDNARLRRELAEEHYKLLDALESNEDLLSKLSTPNNNLDKYVAAFEELEASTLKKHVGTDYKLIVDKVNILWEERYDS